MRIKYMTRAEALPNLRAIDPADLLQEIVDRGVRTLPDLSLLAKKTECPHCGIKGSVGKDFGVRVLGGTVRAQSWCRECRKNPSRMAGTRKTKAAPQTQEDMIALLKANLAKAGIKASQLKSLAKAMGAKA